MSASEQDKWRQDFESRMADRWNEWKTSHPEISVDQGQSPEEAAHEQEDELVRAAWEAGSEDRNYVTGLCKEFHLTADQLKRELENSCTLLDKAVQHGSMFGNQRMSEIPALLLDQKAEIAKFAHDPNGINEARSMIIQLLTASRVRPGTTYEDFRAIVHQKYFKAIAELNLQEQLHAVGFDAEIFPAGPLQRLEQLEEFTNFNQDCKKIMAGCERVVHLWQAIMGRTSSALNLDVQEMHNLRLASLVHDIGKTGPSNISLQSQEAVTKLYAVEGVRDAEHTSVRTVIETYMEWDNRDGKIKMLKALEQTGVDLAQPIRKLYDQHGAWSVEVLKEHQEVFNEQTIEIVAAHHADRDSSPYRKDWWFKPVKEEGVTDTPECRQVFMARLLMVMDKYEAAVRRRHRETGVQLTHHEAVVAVEQLLTPRFREDYFCNKILDLIKASGPEWLFQESPTHWPTRKIAA